MTTSAAFEQMEPVATPFTSTITNLPSHTQVTRLTFSATVMLSADESTLPPFIVQIDGVVVPNLAGWGFNGGAVDGITVVVPHTADQMVVSIRPAAESSDTFSINSESVDVGQDAWINPVQTDSSRDGQRPAVLDLVRGDDTGTPQSTDQSQDVYFTIGRDGCEPGLVGSDGNITPVDPGATYADYGITLDGQSGGVTYDPDTGRFKVTIPAGQSSVRLDFIPTNLFAEPGVPAYLYQVALLPDVTDPTMQIGYDFNAAITDPTTGQATPLPATQPVKQSSLVAIYPGQWGPGGIPDQYLAPLLQQLQGDGWQSALAQLTWLALEDPSQDVYTQIFNLQAQYAQQGNAQLATQLQVLLNHVWPQGLTINLLDNANRAEISVDNCPALRGLNQDT